jgi:hypothetical protein
MLNAPLRRRHSKRFMKKPKLTISIKKPFRRAKGAEDRANDAFASVPRITNDTVAEHREEVLSSARKYIYPLQHSKHRVVRTSIALLLLTVIAFFASCGLALYKFQTTSTFIYDVTRVIPFPIAKAGNSWVSYESYLFELRRNMHYYETQQRVNFATKDGKDQLQRLKQQAFNQVTQDAYVKQLAQKANVVISPQAVDAQVQLVRSQNRLGNNDRVFKDVLSEFWGWNETDFKRELKQQLLQQRVAAVLDTATKTRAEAALAQLKAGADFAVIAAQQSDDPTTKTNGGAYPMAITRSDRDVSPQITAEVFKLKANEISGIIDTGFTLDILKVLSVTSSTSVQAAHIQFNYSNISNYVKPLQTSEPLKRYIKV